MNFVDSDDELNILVPDFPSKHEADEFYTTLSDRDNFVATVKHIAKTDHPSFRYVYMYYLGVLHPLIISS